MPVKARIIRIGNSRGERLPKALLDESGLGELVELEVQSGQITIRPAQRARAGWEEQFQAMADMGDDRLLNGDELPPTQWDGAGWSW